MAISTASYQGATLSRFRFVAAGGETSVSGTDANGNTLSYAPGAEQVYRNGALLIRGTNYTATNGLAITGLSALTAGDVIQVLTFSSFAVTNAVDQTLVDAKGDLLVGTSDNTLARLPVSTESGATIVADSAATTGLRYQPTKSTQQAILNGSFDVWQRGTSFTTTSIYCADRWFTYLPSGSGATWSRQSGSGEFQYVMRLARNNGTTNTASISINQPVAIEEATQFAGKTVTLSFYAKAGANFSAASSAISISLYSGTGSSDVNRALSAYTGDATVLNTTQVINTTLTRYSFTFTLGSSVTQFSPFFGFTPVGTAGANDWFEITGVQLEVGSVATTFRRAGGTLQGELAACQRYYYRIGGSSAYEYFASGPADSTTKAVAWVQFPVTMRTNPTTLDYSTLMLQNNGGGTIYSVTSATIYPGTASSKATFGVYATVASGLTQGTIYGLFANNSTSAYVGFSAEL
jgi:hypothetical protein